MTRGGPPECVAVPPRQAEEARRILRARGLLAQGYKASRQGGLIAFPVVDAGEALEALRGAGIEAVECGVEFEERRRPGSLRGLGLPLRGYSVVGDIAVFSYTPRLGLAVEDYRRAAEALLEEQPRIRAAFLKVATWGELRVQRLVHLAGERRTRTVHREHGLELEVDIARVYFNPRLAYEHRRVAEASGDGEAVLDMFSGVGGFTLHVTALRRARMLAVDLNPYAAVLAARNIARNKRRLRGEALAARADSMVLPEILRPVFTRIIMNHPTQARLFAGAGCRLASPRGAAVHYYTLTVSCAEAEEEALEAFQRCCGRVEVEGCREALSHGPGEAVYAVDLRVKKRG